MLGRSAALGDVRPEVVAAAFVWFEPGLVVRTYRAARAVVPVAEADRYWRRGIADWAERHLPPDLPLRRLGALLGRCVGSAEAAQAPIFAGWRAVDPPSSPAALVVHHLYALRELRGARHACAVLGVGITPRQAVAIRTPWTARLLGWPEPESGVAPVADWAGAEAATDRTMAQVFSCLESAERGELADLLDALLARTGALWTDVPGSPATVPARTSARHAE